MRFSRIWYPMIHIMRYRSYYNSKRLTTHDMVWMKFVSLPILARIVGEGNL